MHLCYQSLSVARFLRLAVTQELPAPEAGHLLQEVLLRGQPMAVLADASLWCAVRAWAKGGKPTATWPA